MTTAPPPTRPLHAATLDAAAAIAARHYVAPLASVRLTPAPGDPGLWGVLIDGQPVNGAHVTQDAPGSRYTFTREAQKDTWWEP